MSRQAHEEIRRQGGFDSWSASCSALPVSPGWGLPKRVPRLMTVLRAMPLVLLLLAWCSGCGGSFLPLTSSTPGGANLPSALTDGVVPSTVHPHDALLDALQVHLRFDGDGGRDASGRLHDALGLASALTGSRVDAMFRRQGSGSLRLDGTGTTGLVLAEDILGRASPVSGAFGAPGSLRFTFAAWLYLNDTALAGNHTTLLERSSAGASSNGTGAAGPEHHWYIGGTGELVYSAPGNVLCRSPAPVPVRQWVHLALARDDTNARAGGRVVNMYKDGALWSSVALGPDAGLGAGVGKAWHLAGPSTARPHTTSTAGNVALGPAHLDDVRVYSAPLGVGAVAALAAVAPTSFLFTEGIPRAYGDAQAASTEWSTWLNPSGSDAYQPSVVLNLGAEARDVVSIDVVFLDRSVNADGCADGTREGFADPVAFPSIAACDGGWTVPGLHRSSPTCARQAGNNGTRTQGCSASDLCAAGWSVCQSATEVRASTGYLPTGCAHVLSSQSSGYHDKFYATGEIDADRQCRGDRGSWSHAAVDRTSFVFGCGGLGLGNESNTTKEAFFKVGDHVLATKGDDVALRGAEPHVTYRGNETAETTFPGSIAARNSDGTYVVIFDDGDQLLYVPLDRIICAMSRPCGADVVAVGAPRASRCAGLQTRFHQHSANGSAWGFPATDPVSGLTKHDEGVASKGGGGVMCCRSQGAPQCGYSCVAWVAVIVGMAVEDAERCGLKYWLVLVG